MRTITRRAAAILLGFVGAVGLAGCSGDPLRIPTGDVEGRVSLDGQPVPMGLVMFVRADGRQGTGQLKSDGTYAAYDVPTGEVTATVNTAMYEGMAKAAAKGAPVPIPAGAKIVAVPKKYMDAKTSGLNFTVSEGRNVIDIELTAK